MAIQEKIKEIEFHIGDIIKVTQTFKEGEKERSSVFEGTVISIKGRGENKMFVVRKTAVDGVGVERIFPLYSPTISKISVKKKGKVRRAKLYYLRKENLK